jgi:hypothetical protein
MGVLTCGGDEGAAGNLEVNAGGGTGRLGFQAASAQAGRRLGQVCAARAH